jgi:hypothetical protein
MNRKSVNQNRAGRSCLGEAPDERGQTGQSGGHGRFPERQTPETNGEVLVCLTRTGLVSHDAMVTGAPERNHRLLEQLGKEQVAVLLGHVGRLTETAAKLLDAVQGLD